MVGSTVYSTWVALVQAHDYFRDARGRYNNPIEIFFPPYLLRLVVCLLWTCVAVRRCPRPGSPGTG